MKRVLNVLLLLCFVTSVSFGSFLFFGKKKEKTPKPVTNPPQQIKVKLPSGKVVTAYRLKGNIKQTPTGTRIILKGKIAKERDNLGSVQLVLRSEAGTNYILLNTPYLLRLQREGIGRKAKLKGLAISKTTFKNYPALYIEDIMDIY